MDNLEESPDSIVSPEDSLTEELQVTGSSNDEAHQIAVGDDGNLLTGVPGYETTGVDGTDDDLTNEQLASPCSITPKPGDLPS